MPCIMTCTGSAPLLGGLGSGGHGRPGGWTSRAESRRSASRLGDSAKTSASAPHGDSAMILDFTELLDTTAARPVHVLSALKVMNETYCLILFKSSTCALVKPTSVTCPWPIEDRIRSESTCARTSTRMRTYSRTSKREIERNKRCTRLALSRTQNSPDFVPDLVHNLGRSDHSDLAGCCAGG
jgi:hypothetical protein